MRDLSRELQDRVQLFLNREFNYIQLEVAETMAAKDGGHLTELIVQPSLEGDALEYANDHDIYELFFEFFEAEFTDEFDESHGRKLSKKLGNIIKEYKESYGYEREDSFDELDMFEFVEYAQSEDADTTTEFIYTTFIKEKEDEFKTYLADNYEDEIREHQGENYPLWGTLFEFKSSVPSEWLDKAQEVGLGVIESTDHFNETLFATSGGHSFLSAYWIPLYLSIFEDEAEKFKGVNYQGL